MHDCRAEFYCYTVYQLARPQAGAPDSLASLGHLMVDPPDHVVLTRGCVANGMIHMCEKRERQPSTSGAMILLTQCCRDAWCNTDRVRPAMIYNGINAMLIARSIVISLLAPTLSLKISYFNT